VEREVRIQSYEVIKIHDTSPRERVKCDECGNRRLCTQLTLLSKDGRKHFRFEYLCNECLTRTPDWPS